MPRRGCSNDLVAGVLGAPVICVTDGHTGLRKAVELVWSKASIQRCAVYAESLAATRSTIGAFERKWRARCPGVVRSLQEGGDELLTLFQFPGRRSGPRMKVSRGFTL
jgi:transposase-like protein